MCLLFVAWRPQAHYRLVVAANRDEFHQRPALPAAPWEDAPDVVGGRDLQGGGGWLAVATGSRFCALTNVREPGRHMAAAPSRGNLVSDFVRSTQEAHDLLPMMRSRAHAYAGFNLLAADARGLWLLTNRPEPHLRPLSPGLYGISNGALDDDWPKIRRGKVRLDALLARPQPPLDALFDLLTDDEPAPDAELPDTGVGLEGERLLSPAFIRHPHYGTRCSTVVLGDADGAMRLMERRFDAAGRVTGESDWTLAADGRVMETVS